MTRTTMLLYNYTPYPGLWGIILKKMEVYFQKLYPIQKFTIYNKNYVNS